MWKAKALPEEGGGGRGRLCSVGGRLGVVGVRHRGLGCWRADSRGGRPIDLPAAPMRATSLASAAWRGVSACRPRLARSGSPTRTRRAPDSGGGGGWVARDVDGAGWWPGPCVDASLPPKVPVSRVGRSVGPVARSSHTQPLRRWRRCTLAKCRTETGRTDLSASCSSHQYPPVPRRKSDELGFAASQGHGRFTSLCTYRQWNFQGKQGRRGPEA